MRDLTEARDKRDEQEYGGFAILLTDGWRFNVPALSQHFDSLRAAKEGIDDHLKATAAEKRAEANKSLRLPVLLENGDEATITGVNARTGNLNGVKDESYVYPPAPWVKKALKARAEAYARARAIDDQIRGLHVYAKTGYGRVTADRYDHAVEKLKQTYAEAEAKLAKMPVPEEWK